MKQGREERREEATAMERPLSRERERWNHLRYATEMQYGGENDDTTMNIIDTY
jgi:hypothetical protein